MWHIAGIEVIDDLHPLVVLMLGWTALAFIVILLRIYTRAVLVRQLGADDWLMAMAMVLSIGTLVGAFYREDTYRRISKERDSSRLIPWYQRSSMAWEKS